MSTTVATIRRMPRARVCSCACETRRTTRPGAALSRPIRRWSTRIAGAAACKTSDVADVTQEVMAQVMRSIADFSYQAERGRFRDWLGTVTRTKILRFLSKDARAGKGGDAASAELVLQVEDPESDTLWTEAFHARVLEVAMQRSRPDFEETTWKMFERSWVHDEAAPNRCPGALRADRIGLRRQVSRLEAVARRSRDARRGLSSSGLILRLTGPTAEPVINVDTCPSDEELERFLAGDDFGAVGLHLRECPRCQESLDRLSDDDDLRPTTTLSGRIPLGLGRFHRAARRSSRPCASRVLLDRCPRTRRQRDAYGGRRMVASSISTPGRLGTYDIEAEIGRGGMGAVYRARDRTTGRLVAVKVLFAGNDDERTRRRFVQEVQRRREGRARSYRPPVRHERPDRSNSLFRDGVSPRAEPGRRDREPRSHPPREAAELWLKLPWASRRPTSRGWCTAMSSRPIFCSTRRPAAPRSATSASRNWRPKLPACRAKGSCPARPPI